MKQQVSYVLLGLVTLILALACDTGGGGEESTPGTDVAASTDVGTSVGVDVSESVPDTSEEGLDTAEPVEDTGDPEPGRIDEALAYCEAFGTETGLDYEGAACGVPDTSSGHADCDYTMCNHCYALSVSVPACEDTPDMCPGGSMPAFFPDCDAELVLCLAEIDCASLELLEASTLISECQTAAGTCQQSYQ